MRFTRLLKYRNGADFQSALQVKMKLVASKHVYWQEVNPLCGKKNLSTISKGKKSWYSWIFNPLFGQMKTRSAYRVAKEELNFQFTPQEKNELLYSCRLAEKSLDFQSSLRVKRKCCRVGMSKTKELEVQSALWR